MNVRTDTLAERRMGFSERLRQLLHQQGRSIDPAELATDFTTSANSRLVCASPQTFSNWLNGIQMPQPRNMQALAKWLSVTTELLAHGVPVLHFAPVKIDDADTAQLVDHFQKLDGYGRRCALAMLGALARLKGGGA